MSRTVWIALIAVAAAVTRGHLAWGQVGFAPGESMDPSEALRSARASDAPEASPRVIPAGYVAAKEPGYRPPGAPEVPVEWVRVVGGLFTMGTDDLDCNWNKPGRERHPVNCVSWRQAGRFAQFMKARLPSESEWEYAATGAGKNQPYPWGKEAPSRETAVSCEKVGMMPVCSKPAGNAKVSGGELCDMVGSLWQWVEDDYRDSYKGAPEDGSSRRSFIWSRVGVVRGGSFASGCASADLRADHRGHRDRDDQWETVGFRIVRDDGW